jgi:hypothetical protein
MTAHDLMLWMLIVGMFAALAIFACTDNDPWDR